MTPQEVRRAAKHHAGLMLMGNLNGWEPDELVQQLGQETVDRIAQEMTSIARQLIRDGRS